MKSPESKLRRLWVGGTLFSVILVCWYAFPPAPGAREIHLDLRYRHTNRFTAASPRVVVVDIDEAGRDPAETARELRRRLAPAGPTAILFEEPKEPLDWESPPEGLKAPEGPSAERPSRAVALMRFREGLWYPSRPLAAVMATLKGPPRRLPERLPHAHGGGGKLPHSGGCRGPLPAPLLSDRSGAEHRLRPRRTGPRGDGRAGDLPGPDRARGSRRLGRAVGEPSPAVSLG